MNTDKTLQVSQISSSNTQSQHILESEASVPHTNNYKNQQFMKSPIVENIISDEEEEFIDKVDKEIGKEKKLIVNDDLDDFEEEELGENKKEKEVDELDDDDDDDNANDDNEEAAVHDDDDEDEE
jgi:hypothetical protein